jgi:hypothetical protein
MGGIKVRFKSLVRYIDDRNTSFFAKTADDGI